MFRAAKTLRIVYILRTGGGERTGKDSTRDYEVICVSPHSAESPVGGMLSGCRPAVRDVAHQDAVVDHFLPCRYIGLDNRSGMSLRLGEIPRL